MLAAGPSSEPTRGVKTAQDGSKAAQGSLKTASGRPKMAPREPTSLQDAALGPPEDPPRPPPEAKIIDFPIVLGRFGRPRLSRL
eukprot:5341163-Pyramimonas_sp.AAC.1